jgi:hypothetical protein
MSYTDNSFKSVHELAAPEEAIKRLHFPGGILKNATLKKMLDAEKDFGLARIALVHANRQVYSVKIDFPNGVDSGRVMSKSHSTVYALVDAETKDILATCVETEPSDTHHRFPKSY